MFRVLQFNMQFGMGWNAASPDDVPIDIEATIAAARVLRLSLRSSRGGRKPRERNA